MDTVLLFPGQGSQKPGMGRDLADAFSAAREVFARADAALHLPLSRLCFNGPAEELTLTYNAQPALFAHGAAVWATVRDRLAPHVRATAGHSLGEFTAYHAADALSLTDGLDLVRERGRLMYESGLERPGAMAAVLGDLSTPIEGICEQATREAGLVVVANYNCPGQLVVSGEIAGVERASVLAKEAGAKRTIRLQVSGAFHSPLMDHVSPGLADALRRSPIVDPSFPVFANVSAEPVTTAEGARRVLLEQLIAAVRWSAEIVALAVAFPTAVFLEMGPGTVLTGLVRKIVPDRRVFPCGTVADVTRLLEMLPS